MLTWMVQNTDTLHLGLTHLSPLLHSLPQQVPGDAIILAQQFEQDVMGDAQQMFQKFVESGQVWALLIGIIVGYLFNSLTRFG
ncbi:MAG: hypothetical protein AAGF24_13705 [Cyanobacteria bacterium P01_H01_bin.121]